MEKNSNFISYTPDLCESVPFVMETEGKTPEEVAKIIGVSKETFDGWTYEHPEFNEALKEGLNGLRVYWLREMRLNLSNLEFDADHAMQIMCKYFNWQK